MALKLLMSLASTILVLQMRHVFGGGKMLKYQDQTQASCSEKGQMAMHAISPGFLHYVTRRGQHTALITMMAHNTSCTYPAETDFSKCTFIYIFATQQAIFISLTPVEIIRTWEKQRKTSASIYGSFFFFQHCQLTLNPLHTSSLVVGKRAPII